MLAGSWLLLYVLVPPAAPAASDIPSTASRLASDHGQYLLHSLPRSGTSMLAMAMTLSNPRLKVLDRHCAEFFNPKCHFEQCKTGKRLRSCYVDGPLLQVRSISRVALFASSVNFLAFSNASVLTVKGGDVTHQPRKTAPSTKVLLLHSLRMRV
jgi:hypothetical protein